MRQPRHLHLRSARARCLAATAVAVAVLGAATGVNALTANGSREYSQDAPGVNGAVEVGDFFAASLAIGDFNNDGRGDVVAGAPYEDFGGKRDAGQVHVLYGRSSGLDTGNDAIFSEDSANVKGRAEANDLFGSTVATGDFDNDGYDDAVIGVPGEDVRGRADAGGLVVLYGSRSGLRGKASKTYNQASKGISGNAEAYGYLGASLAVGDFNSDGFDDVAVGAPGAANSGLVHVLYGSRDGIKGAGDLRLHRGLPDVAGNRAPGDDFGASLAAGDFDNDGDDDLAVGVPGAATSSQPSAGAVQIFEGSKRGIRPGSSRLITQATDGVADSPEKDDLFGASLAAGDFNGDKRADLAVGAPGESKKARVAAGKVHVFYGTRNGVTATGSKVFSQSTKRVKSKAEAGDEFGLSLAAGDFNGNNRVDLAIGAPGETIRGRTGAGVVHVLFGTAKGLDASKHQWFWPGQNGIPGQSQATAGFSRALAAGDIDGDGRDDLLAGSPGQKIRGDASAGALTLIPG